MADTSRLNEGLATLAAKVDELVAYKNANPQPADSQPEIDAAAEYVQAILARIP